jgi:Mg-chelatase subunit ChlD
MTMRTIRAAGLAAATLSALLASLAPDWRPLAAVPAAAQPAREAYVHVSTWANSDAPYPAGLLREVTDLAAAPDGAVVLDGIRGQIHRMRDKAWAETWSLGGRVAEPVAVALMGDQVVVADRTRGLVVFTAAGAFVRQMTGVGAPEDLAVVGDRIYVADGAASRIHVLDLAGTRVASYGGAGSSPGRLDRVTAVDAFADGRIVVLDGGNNRIQGWAADGEPEWTLANQESLPWVDVAATGADTFAIAGVRLLSHFRVGGNRFAYSSAPVPGGYTAVAALHDTDFALWLGIRQDYLNGLRYYATPELAGTEQYTDLPGPPGEFESPRRLVVIDGTVLVADAWPRLQRLTLDGQPIDQWQIELVNDIAADPPALYVAQGSSVRRVLDVMSFPIWSWEAMTETAWFSGLAFVPGPDSLHTVDLKAQSIVAIDEAGAFLGASSLRSPRHQSFTDIDTLPDGRLLLVNRTAAALEVRETDGRLVRSLPVRGVPLRAAVTPDGGAVVMTREGWIWKLRPDGADVAWFDAAADAPGRRGILGDVAVTGDGRILVADADADEIRVYAVDPEVPPPPPPTGEGCQFVRDKWAAPRRIPLGATVDVTLTVTGECLEEGRGADIVLVIDRSGSMRGAKMEAARNAAVAFVGEMDLDVSRVGVVLFSDQASLAMTLTNSAEAVIDAVVGFGAPQGGTDIGEGIQLGAAELSTNGRPEAERILIVMSDGRPEAATVDADAAADAAKAAGFRVFSIGFGGDADPALMRRIASAPGDYYFAPGTAELSTIYTEIARRITGGIIAQTMTITDVVPANMTLVPGSVNPAPAEFANRVLRWVLNDIRGQLTLGYKLQPQQTGTWPTNDFAGADYRDGRGVDGRLVFPVPEVLVVLPPEPIYLPVVYQRYCLPKSRHADVALVIDTSSSMTGEKLRAAQSAARLFVDRLRLPLDRAAVIGFNSAARLAVGLTGDRAALIRAIDGLAVETGTVVDAGIQAGHAELMAGRDRENTPVLVLLTDGQNNRGPGPVLAAAEAARADGIVIFTVALGDTADLATLQAVAGDPARAYVALTPADLQTIYAEIAGVIPCG